MKATEVKLLYFFAFLRNKVIPETFWSYHVQFV